MTKAKLFFRLCARLIDLAENDDRVSADWSAFVEALQRDPATASEKPQANLVANTPSVAAQSTSDDGLAGIVRRCLLKAEAASVTLTCDAATRRDLWAQAAAIGSCSLWMLNLLTADATNLDNLRQCYTALAEALALASEARASNSLGPSLQLLAEAQSALRAAVKRLSARADADQAAAFHWLLSTKYEHHIHVARFMRTDDAAAPENSADLLRRIRAAAEAMST